MLEEIASKLENCYEADAPEKEIVVKKPDGAELCRFTVRQLTIYEIQAAQDSDPVKLNFNLIKLGVKRFAAPSGKTVEEAPLPDEFINSLYKSRLSPDGQTVITGLFETMAAAVLGINTVTEAEAKN